MDKKQLDNLKEHGNETEINDAIDELNGFIEVNGAKIDELSQTIDIMDYDVDKLNKFKMVVKNGVSENEARKKLKLTKSELTIIKKLMKAESMLSWNEYCVDELMKAKGL